MNGMILRALSIVILLGFTQFSFAADPCGEVIPEYRDFRDMIHKVAVYDDPDRRTEEDYATENKTDLATIQKRFGATGTINCNGAKGSAQLTIKNNIITTVAHALKDPNKCRTWAKATDCIFSIRSNGKIRDIKVEKSFANGFDGADCPHLLADDWAVFKLAESVDDIEPYQVDPRAIKNARVGQDVVAIGRSMDFMNLRRHLGNCKLKSVYSWKYTTNCDGAEGISGGSLVSGNVDHPTLLGIFVDGSETEDQLKAALKAGKVNSGKYDEQTWRSTILAIQGDFYRALIDAARQP